MKKLLILATLLLVLVVTVVACQPGTQTEDTTVAPDVTVEPTTDVPSEESTEAPEVTEEPTETPEVTEEPTEAPEVTEEPTEAPEVTEEPTNAPTETNTEPSHEHSYISAVTAPTCTAKGYTTYTCACGYTYTADETAALGHSFADGICDTCGAVDPDSENPAGPTYKAWYEDMTIVGHVCVDQLYKGNGGLGTDDGSIFAPGQFGSWNLATTVTTAEKYLMAWGWAAFMADFDGQYGYRIDDADEVFGDYDYGSDVASVAPNYGCVTAHRFYIDINIFGLSAGDHTVNVLYKNGSGEAVALFTFTLTVTGTPHVHTYTETVTAPTCTTAGYTTYTCDCGDTYTADEVAALGHSFVDGICGTCGAEEPGTVQKISNDLLFVGTDDGETSMGTNYESWSPKIVELELGKFNYLNDLGWVAFTSDSYVFGYIVNGVEHYSESFARNAEQGVWDIATKAGATNCSRYSGKLYPESLSAGENNVKFVIKLDGGAVITLREYTVIITVPAHEHTEETIPGKDATCTETGLTEGKKCSFCGEILVEQTVIEALGHSFENGTCCICGAEEPGTVQKFSNDFLFVSTDDGDTSMGANYESWSPRIVELELGKFNYLNDLGWVAFTSDSYVFGYIVNGVEHYSESFARNAEQGVWDVATKAGATNCSRYSGKLYPEYLSAGENNVKFVIKLDGGAVVTLREYTVIFTVPAHEHIEETILGKDATCTETGLTEGKKCSFCGEILVEQTEIEALGHTEETVAAKAATCTETGLTEGKKCSTCGEILVEQTVIEALGHTFENGTCGVCGEADPDYEEPAGPTYKVWDEDKAIVGHVSVDQLYKGNGGLGTDDGSIFKTGHFGGWNHVATVTTAEKYLMAWGWAAFKADFDGQYGYRIDDADEVFGDYDYGSDVASVAPNYGCVTAHRFYIEINISDLAVGDHTVNVLYKNGSGEAVALFTFTLTVTEASN